MAVADRVCVEALDLVAALTEGADYTIDRSERRIDLTRPAAFASRAVATLARDGAARWCDPNWW